MRSSVGGSFTSLNYIYPAGYNVGPVNRRFAQKALLMNQISCSTLPSYLNLLSNYVHTLDSCIYRLPGSRFVKYHQYVSGVECLQVVIGSSADRI